MKKISKSAPPNPLTQFEAQNPGNSWKSFRRYNRKRAYKEVKRIIFEDQGQLCAYCEARIAPGLGQPLSAVSGLQSIEHFHEKSDFTDPNKNWGLDWNNVIGVCKGGREEGSEFPLPINLSCDAHKDHVRQNEDLSGNCWFGRLLNPLLLKPSLCPFSLKVRTGELEPNSSVCADMDIEENNFASVEALILETIRILNLNCDRLNRQRLELIDEYNRQVAEARLSGNRNIFDELATRWFSEQWPSNFTTRRILLGKHAEKYLDSHNYNG